MFNGKSIIKISMFILIVVMMLSLTSFIGYGARSENLLTEEVLWGEPDEHGYYDYENDDGERSAWHKEGKLWEQFGYMPVEFDGRASCETIRVIDILKYQMAINKGDMRFTANFHAGSKYLTAASTATLRVDVGTESLSSSSSPWYLTWDTSNPIGAKFNIGKSLWVEIRGGNRVIIRNPELYLYDDVAPQVKSIDFSDYKKVYQSGDKIDIYVEFDETIKVIDSNVHLILEDGSIASYVSGDNSHVVKFSYIVGPNGFDLSKDTVIVKSIDNTEAIRDLCGSGNGLQPITNVEIGRIIPPVLEDVYGPNPVALILALGGKSYGQVNFPDIGNYFHDIEGDGLDGIRIVSQTQKGILYDTNNDEMLKEGKYILRESSNAAAIYKPFESININSFSFEDSFKLTATERSNTNLESNEAIYTLIMLIRPVTEDFSVEVPGKAHYYFTESDFLSHYKYDAYQPLNYITITGLPDPSVGKLTNMLDGSDIIMGQRIYRDNLSTIRFSPTSDKDIATSFTYIATDNSDLESKGTSVNISVKAGPKEQAIIRSDIRVYIDIPDEVHTFNASEFLDVYYDLEGELKAVKVMDFPDLGQLLYGDINQGIDQLVPVSEGEVIALEDVDKLHFKVPTDRTINRSFTWTGFNGDEYSRQGTVLIRSFDPNVNYTPYNTDNYYIYTQANVDYTFRLADFREHYIDYEEQFAGVYIRELPINPLCQLLYKQPDGSLIPVVQYQFIEVENIENLIFSSQEVNAEYSFIWSASDGHLLTPDTRTTINFSTYSFIPPHREDIKIPCDIDTSHFFTSSEFNLSVGSGDMEFITIMSLPDFGSLQYNRTFGETAGIKDVYVGQRIRERDIQNLSFVPQPGFDGTATFTWQSGDLIGFGNIAKAEMVYEYVNTKPELKPFNVTSYGRQDVSIEKADFLSNYSDENGEELRYITITELPIEGELWLDNQLVVKDQKIYANNYGSFVYKPATTMSSNVLILCTVSDGIDDSVDSFVTVVYNASPIVSELNKVENEDDSVTFCEMDFLVSYMDIEGDPLEKIKIVNEPLNGVLTVNDIEVFEGRVMALNEINSLVFVPDKNWNGTTFFRYQSYDGHSFSDDERVNITVNAVNDQPTMEIIQKNTSDNVNIDFTKEEFGNAFYDVENSPLLEVRLIEFVDAEDKLSELGTFMLGDCELIFSESAPVEILFEDLDLLKFIPKNGFVGSAALVIQASDSSGTSTEWSEESVLIINVTSSEKPEPKPDPHLQLYTVRVSIQPAGAGGISGYGTGFTNGSAYQLRESWTAEGYVFDRFEGGASSGVISGSDISVIAVFKPIKQENPVEPDDMDSGDVTENLMDEESPQDVSFLYLFYNDLDSKRWAAEDINFLTQKKIIFGRDEFKFKPGENVTRAEFTAYLVNLMDVYNEDALEPFDDVDENTLYHQHIASGYEAGLIEGYSISEFGPNDYITREDIMVIMERLLVSKYDIELSAFEELPFIDTKKISDYARRAVVTSFDYELIIGDVGINDEGVEGQVVRPKDFMNRAEAATVIRRLFTVFNKH